MKDARGRDQLLSVDVEEVEFPGETVGSLFVRVGVPLFAWVDNEDHFFAGEPFIEAATVILV